MIIIIDSNILVSAIIKDGFTRELIVQCKEQLVAPEYLFQEIRNNEEEILLKSKLNIKDYRDLLKILLKYITIIPNEVIMSHREEAIKRVETSPINIAGLKIQERTYKHTVDTLLAEV